MATVIGVHIGQKSEFTGICVLEIKVRNMREMHQEKIDQELTKALELYNHIPVSEVTARMDAIRERERNVLIPDRNEAHFYCRHLERLNPGTNYPQILQRIKELADALYRREEERPSLRANITGIGASIIERMRRLSENLGWIHAVYLNQGSRKASESRGNYLEVNLGKSYMISRLQLLLQEGRLHLPRTGEAEILVQDLLDYEIDVAASAAELPATFKVGSRDELVTALGVAVWLEPRTESVFVL